MDERRSGIHTGEQTQKPGPTAGLVLLVQIRRHFFAACPADSPVVLPSLHPYPVVRIPDAVYLCP